jgi:hypothetical protein
MNKLSRPTMDSLVPLPIVTRRPVRPLKPRYRSLTDLISQADGVIIGRITRNHLFRIERGHELESYFTTLSIEGRPLSYRKRGGSTPSICLDVTFKGGSILENQGVFNPGAPGTDEVQVGTRVVLFHRWMKDLGAKIQGHGLAGMKGGLYLTRRLQGNTWVRGRGQGFGIANDLPLSELSARISSILGSGVDSKASH